MQHRKEELESAKIEILKIYTSILRQSNVIEGIESGFYSNTVASNPVFTETQRPKTRGLMFTRNTASESCLIKTSTRESTFTCLNLRRHRKTHTAFSDIKIHA